MPQFAPDLISTGAWIFIQNWNIAKKMRDIMINIGVIGYGYWGPNLVRNFMNNSDTCVLTVCDVTKTRLEKSKDPLP